MLNNIAKTFRVLGHKSKDRITGAEGVVTTVTFDLYGCIQVLLNPGLDKDGKLLEQHWLDINRLEPIAVDAERVMGLPEHLQDLVGDAEAYMRAPDDNKVICPSCTHQFTAVPVAVQNRIAELEERRPLHVPHTTGAAEKPLPAERSPMTRF